MRVASGHIHGNGKLEYSQRDRSAAISGSTKSWTPTRDKVKTKDWTTYDPEKKKMRRVMAEGERWYIERGGIKDYF